MCGSRGRLRRTARATAAGLAALFLAVAPAAAVTPDDLCTGDPCVIDGAHTIPTDGIELDFGGREVVFTSGGRLTFVEEDPLPGLPDPPDVLVRTGPLTMNAGSFILNEGGETVLEIDGDALLAGDVETDGPRGEDGGDVAVAATGSLRLEGAVTATGGRILDGSVGDGGNIELQAGGALTIDHGSGVSVDASGGAGNSEDGGGSGGDIELRAIGALTLESGRVKGVGKQDGDGSDLTLVSGGALVALAPIGIDGGPDDGVPGAVGAVADAAVTLDVALVCRALSVEAAGRVDVDDAITCDTIAIAAAGDLDLAAAADLTARLSATIGGAVTLTAGGTVTIPSRVRADGTDTGGQIQVLGCAVTVSGPGEVNASGADGTVELGGGITIAGDVLAQPGGTITFVAAAAAPPVVQPGATVDPPAIDVVEDAVLACCGAACDDADPCTADGCVPIEGCTNARTAATDLVCTAPCTGAPDGRPCLADDCTSAGTCQAGTCAGGSPIVCDDADVCNGLESCNPIGGCVPGTPLPCNDGDDCNGVETCNPASGCEPGSPLPDGLLCIVEANCIYAGVCQSGTCAGIPYCTDGDPCHRGVCTPGTGCSFVDDACPTSCAGLPNGTKCSDGNLCNVGSFCSGGACFPGSGCNDGDGCTLNLCGANGCAYFEYGIPPACAITCANQPDGTRCFDFSLCTDDVCTAGACVSTPKACDDGDPTNGLEYCDPDVGCRPGVPICAVPGTPDGAPCDDGDACTQGDICQAGTCAGTPVVCAPPDQCHAAGVCEAATGLCIDPPLADGTACDDGDACTTGDTCQAGTCTGGTPVACAPPDQCHAPGVCEAATGLCTDPPLADGTACDDGDACTTVDTCQAGTCTGGTPVVCAPPDQCHAPGVCEAATGLCTNPPVADGTACDDGLYCVVGETCTAGACGGGGPRSCTGCNPRVCNEATDRCEPAG